jgi:5-methylcytosine-specific restriction enzyme subunit McrC
MAIPIANIYYLLCYAWDEFAPRQMTDVAGEQFPDTMHLFSRLLVVGLRSLHRRGFERGYVPIEQPTGVVRGRILMRNTARVRTRRPQQVFCAFDDLSADVLSNQILKATIRRILGEDTLNASLRGELRRGCTLFPEVSDINLTPRVFHEVRLHQNNRLYSFLIHICRFFYESLQALEQPGRFRFRDVDRDEKRMRRVFEKFVRNFFARRQRMFTVKRDRIEWVAVPIGNSDPGLLPAMETDVTLRSMNKTIVIECKYTESLYQRHFFKDKLRSAHLYQLYAYLRNLENRGMPDAAADGILLYPAVNVKLDQSYSLNNHNIRIATIDLCQPWRDIEKQMLMLVDPILILPCEFP